MPADDIELSDLARVTLDEWMAMKPLLMPQFQLLPTGRLSNERLMEESEKQHNRSKSGSKGGSKKQANISAKHVAALEDAIEVENEDGNDTKLKLIPVEKFVEIWNQTADLAMPRVQTVSEDRRRHIDVRRKDKWWSDHFQEAVQKMSRSDFCKGQSGGTWVADFDWLLKPSTMARVIEGKYDNRGTNVTPVPEPNQIQEQIIIKTL